MLSGKVEQHPRSSTIPCESSRMMCLNCSRPHAEGQWSCVQPRERNLRSQQSQLNPNQLVTPSKIPSLLVFPLLHASNRVSEHHSRSSQLPISEDEMDCT